MGLPSKLKRNNYSTINVNIPSHSKLNITNGTKYNIQINIFYCSNIKCHKTKITVQLFNSIIGCHPRSDRPMEAYACLYKDKK